MRPADRSPVDGTPTSSLRATVAAVLIGYGVAMVLNPASPGRWAYMLGDGPGVQAVQDMTGAISARMEAIWTNARLPIPFDAARKWGQTLRDMAGADP